MRTYRFKINESTTKTLNIGFTPPVGTLAARCVATNSSGSSTTLTGAVVINGSNLEVTIPNTYAVYGNFPAKFEIQLQVNGGAWYTEVEAYGALVSTTVSGSDTVQTITSAVSTALNSPAVESKIDTLVGASIAEQLIDVDAAVAEAVEAHTPGIELGYAERTTSFTTTVNAQITGFTVTVVGKGRPVDVEFYCAQATHTTVGTYVQAVILHGAGTQLQGAGDIISSTTLGRAIHIRQRMTLTDGVSYTFFVNTTQSAAGTATWAASATRPMWLSVVSR